MITYLLTTAYLYVCPLTQSKE